MPRCPQCGNGGRKVKRVTLESLLRADCRADIGGEPHYVCVTPDCETVYFSGGNATTFRKADLSVRFGLKEAGPPRPVCYCFDHGIEEIHDEIRRTGSSTVLAGIRAAMKGPGCRCEYTNPLGGCCLKSVREAVEQGFRLVGREGASAGDGVGDHEDCCDADAARAGLEDETHEDRCLAKPDARGVEAPRRRAGVMVAAGSVLAAILSSACCWLPLVLVAFGASAAGVAGFFGAHRAYFITGALVMLGIGFYTVYFRRQACAQNSACATPDKRVRAFSRIMLWTATGLVGAFVFFPNYVGYLLATPAQRRPVTSGVPLVEMRFDIEGMTCAGCAEILRGALERIPQVKSVEVDYPTKAAIVRHDPNMPVAHQEVIAAIEGAGYTGTVAR